MRNARHLAEEKLKANPVETHELSYGRINLIDNHISDKEILLSIHGLFGGYDQAFNNVVNFDQELRILAPSRFGYLGSSTTKENSPTDQANAFVELLDELKIKKVFLIGTSAGGTPAIRMALDHPERVKGVILLSSASPLAKPSDKIPEWMGPPDFLNQDFFMWLLSPLFDTFLGVESETIHWLLPMDQRRQGVDIDARITIHDMWVHYDQYPIEQLKVPVLILHAKDDQVVPFDTVVASISRHPNQEHHFFETGGHLLKRHETEVQQIISDFIRKNK